MKAHRGTSRRWKLLAVAIAIALVAAACGDDDDDATPSSGDDTVDVDDGGDDGSGADGFKFGMILVGPENDRGWSQAHVEGGQYVVDQTGAEMIIVEKVNPADKPDITVEQVVDDLIEQGADLIFATSDDMKDGIVAAARAHPDVPMIWSSGDSAWADGQAFEADLTNLGNIMGRMEFGKMIAGCAASLASETGEIGYLGPLINDETRRLVSSAFLGAEYCWEDAGNAAGSLDFSVTWIGFWFNIPGVTLDPTQVVNEFYDSGADVVISGIDTTEAIVRTGQRADAGESVYAVPYDFEGACAEAESICLGVPYFNWGPEYVSVVEGAAAGDFEADFVWAGPDWSDINSRSSSTIGFVPGDGLSADDAATLDGFIAGLADGSIDLFTGPLNFQDGSSFLGDGEVATDTQVWYLDQLLEGIEGASSAG